MISFVVADIPGLQQNWANRGVNVGRAPRRPIKMNTAKVRYLGEPGKYRLILSLTGFDPSRSRPLRPTRACRGVPENRPPDAASHAPSVHPPASRGDQYHRRPPLQSSGLSLKLDAEVSRTCSGRCPNSAREAGRTYHVSSACPQTVAELPEPLGGFVPRASSNLKAHLPIFVLIARSAFAQPILTSFSCHLTNLPSPGSMPGHIPATSALQ